MILHGKCADEMALWIDDSTIDSVVTDPPYGLKFMGKRWDYKLPSIKDWEQCLRVLKPGSHLLAFSSTRTYHRMVCAIEDAGFEIRDQIGWLYGQGMPKSKNLDDIYKGWGTGLKPAWEPICVARKPLVGTVESNMLIYGVGALSIDACRVETSNSLGRWPANIIHDGSDEVLAAFPTAPGQQGDLHATGRTKSSTGIFGQMGPPRTHLKRNDSTTSFAMQAGQRRLDEGSASRFFYCAKATTAERNANLPAGLVNDHPTVKPVALCAYLQRLVTPPGGVTLDPFCGSGSFGVAAKQEGFSYICIDEDAHSVAITTARVA